MAIPPGQLAVDVLDYAVLNNHLHVVLQNRPDRVADWTDAEVILRWWYLCPNRREADGTPTEPVAADLNRLRSDQERVAQYRARRPTRYRPRKWTFQRRGPPGEARPARSLRRGSPTRDFRR